MTKTFRLYQGETKITSCQAETRKEAEVQFLEYLCTHLNKKGLYGFTIVEKNL